MLSVAPMPCPDSMYQGAAGVTSACFQDVPSRLVAARDETRLRRGDLLHRVDDATVAADLRGVRLGTHDDEVVVHDEPPVLHLALGEVLLLQGRRMAERHVGF